MQLLQNDKILESVFRIQNSVSPLSVVDELHQLLDTVTVPEDRQNKGKLVFAYTFFKKANVNNLMTFQQVLPEVMILIRTKSKKNDDFIYFGKDFMASRLHGNWQER